MDLSLTDDQELFRQTTRKFLEDSVPLAAVRLLAEEQPRGFDAEWWQQGAELGWVSMLVSEEHGGGSVSGRGLSDLGLVAEEMGRLVSPGPLAPTNVVAGALSRTGSPAQAKQWVGDLVSGVTVATWCIGGPSARHRCRDRRIGWGGDGTGHGRWVRAGRHQPAGGGGRPGRCDSGHRTAGRRTRWSSASSPPTPRG